MESLQGFSGSEQMPFRAFETCSSPSFSTRAATEGVEQVYVAHELMGFGGAGYNVQGFRV